MRKVSLRSAIAVAASAALLSLAGTAPATAATNTYSAQCFFGGNLHLGIVHGVQAWTMDPGAYTYTGHYCAVGKAYLTLQTDGNFVVYDENNRARWAANTQNVPGRTTLDAVFQEGYSKRFL